MTYILTIFAETPILIDGQHNSFTVDKSTARKVLDMKQRVAGEQESTPYLPASAVKGALRIEFERLVRSIDPTICNAPDPKTMCAGPKDPCIACRLFGGPNSCAGKLRFHDALPLQRSFPQNAYAQRTGVSISRQLRKVEGKKLYSQEAAPSHLKYQCVISLLDVLSEEERARFERVLVWCELEGLCIGGNRSRGMGRLAIQVRKSDPTTAGALVFKPKEQRKVYKVSFERDRNQREPMRVSSYKTGTYLLKSLDFLPGSTVRGAAAWGWTRAGLSKAEVSELILCRSRFSHLYCADLSEMRPASAVRCKQEPTHGPFDTLILRFLWKQAKETDNREALGSLFFRLDSCPYCGGGLAPAEPFEQNVDRQLMIKLGLNRKLGHAKENLFYIYETLNSQTTYSGFLYADEGVEALPESLPVFIGGARGKGFGKGTLKIESDPPTSPGDTASIKQRVDSFQRRLTDIASDKDYRLDLPQDRVYFSLLLLTDLVLPPDITLKALLEREGWQWEAAQVGWARLGGFNEAACQPKPLVSVLERGGAVLVSAPVNETSTDQLAARLSEIEREGLGLMRTQGFGWVYSNHDFHSFGVLPKKEKTDGTATS